MPMRGEKWMNEATYLTDEDREAIMAVVRECKLFCIDMIGDGNSRLWYEPKSVGARPATYCGEPHPIAVVTYGPGGSTIYKAVHRRTG